MLEPSVGGFRAGTAGGSADGTGRFQELFFGMRADRTRLRHLFTCAASRAAEKKKKPFSANPGPKVRKIGREGGLNAKDKREHFVHWTVWRPPF
jgi:hypothetical protein